MGSSHIVYNGDTKKHHAHTLLWGAGDWLTDWLLINLRHWLLQKKDVCIMVSPDCQCHIVAQYRRSRNMMPSTLATAQQEGHGSCEHQHWKWMPCSAILNFTTPCLLTPRERVCWCFSAMDRHILIWITSSYNIVSTYHNITFVTSILEIKSCLQNASQEIIRDWQVQSSLNQVSQPMVMSCKVN